MSELARISIGPRDDRSAADSYDVVLGHELMGEVGALLPAGVERVAIIADPAVADAAARIRRSLGASISVLSLDVLSGEAAKTVAGAAALWDALGAAGFTRSDAIVAVGGGATTDLAGFVAATWLRGVPVVHVPTTVLGMVDAAVGGKTGINIAAGKNLVGAFHPPAGVLCDLDLLRSLHEAELRAGMAEVVKVGFIADEQILSIVERDAVNAVDIDSDDFAELVRRAIQVKAEVVTDDLREKSSNGIGREMLNYGHTLAHAIERNESYGWRHGDAVAVGMLYAAKLGELAGRHDAALTQRHRHVVEMVGLPTGYDGAFDELLPAMRVDKKARGSRLRFVVLEGIGRPVILDDPDESLVRAAYSEVSR